VELTIEAMRPSDWEAVRKIYLEGIETGNATFETGAPEWEAWDRAHLVECRLVARNSLDLLGWAALGRVSARAVYRGVAEVSVYVAAAVRGRGVGRALLEGLVADSEAAGVWMLQASIFPENETSIHLHLACGFREVGRRERIGRHHDVWRDTVLLERRSAVAGV